jgi:hypothetical protein
MDVIAAVELGTRKTPYHDGTTHIALEPLDFIASATTGGAGERTLSNG